MEMVGAELNRFFSLYGFCLGSASKRSSGRLKGKRQEGLKYLFPLECCSSVTLRDHTSCAAIPLPDSAFTLPSPCLLRPRGDTGFSVLLCLVSQYPSLDVETLMERIPNCENISLKCGSGKPALSSRGPNSCSF